MTRNLIVTSTLVLLLSGCGQTGGQPVEDTAADTEDIPGLNLCTAPRPEICPQNYAPVCGVHDDGSRQTYSNGCVACSKVEVVGWLPGACPD